MQRRSHSTGSFLIFLKTPRCIASYADVLRLVTRSSPRTWGGTRDKPKNVCVGGYSVYLTNKEASTVLCSVVKHAGSGRGRKKCRGKHETQWSVFPHFLSALPLPECFTTEQSSVEAALFVL